MPNRNRALAGVTVLLAVGFCAGAIQLFMLRFGAGDVYPPYSSLRADPLGTKALYESLGRLPGATASRNLRPLDVLRADGGVAFYVGMNPWLFRLSDARGLERLESILANGGRLVIVFEPEREPLNSIGVTQHEPPALEQRWGVRLANIQPAKRAADDDEPDGLPRETLLYFDHLDPAWRTLREQSGRATAILRPLGAGSIALVANGYLLSNEALLDQRETGLIAALIDGPAPRFTFDEYHFGIEETGSVVALGRKYGLQGLAGGLLLLAALFIWKSSSSFLPARDSIEQAAEGKSAASGFVNMLRRGVSAAALAPLCALEWRKSLALGSFCPEKKRKRVEEIAAAGDRDPLGAYVKISRILAEKDIG